MNNSNLFSNDVAAAKAVKDSFFAEVIESRLDSFTAQCWVWDYLPEFGSLVQVESGDLLLVGVVTHIQTGSMDPMRYPFPYQKTEEELRVEQPQIFEFLKTSFNVHVLCYGEKKRTMGSALVFLLPPVPAKIHGFVGKAPLDVYEAFFQKMHFLNMLFFSSQQIINLDELLLALLQQLAKRKLLTQEKLEPFCDRFSLLTGNDYRRLKLFLARVEELL